MLTYADLRRAAARLDTCIVVYRDYDDTYIVVYRGYDDTYIVVCQGCEALVKRVTEVLYRNAICVLILLHI